MDRELKVRISADTKGVDQALKGTSRAVQQAEQQQRRSKDETRRAVERSEQEKERAARRAAERSTKAVEESERRKRREIHETERAARRAHAAGQARDRGGRFTGGGRGGGLARFAERAMGGAAGVGTAALSRLQSWQGALGIPSREQLVQLFIRSQQDFIRTANQAGLSREQREQLQGRVMDVSRRTNTDPTSLLSSLTVAQNRFSDLGFVADNLEMFASTAQATGSSVDDWVGAVGEFRRQLGVTTQDVPELIGAMVSAAREGSIEAGDVAANFSGLMSSFTTLRGDGARGGRGAREFLATAQALGGAGMSPEGTRTLMENLFTALRRSTVQRGIERQLRDRNIFDRGGRLTVGMDELLGRMAQNEAFSTPAGLERIGFTDVQAQTAISALMNQFRSTGGNEVARLMNVSSDEGNAVVRNTMSELMNSSSGRALNQQITAETNFMQNGERLVNIMTDLTGPLTDFQTRMPIASEALSFLSDAARNTGISIAAMRLFGGAGAGAVPAAGAAPAALGGGGLLATAGAALAGFGAGFFGTIALANETGTFATGDGPMGRSLGQQWDEMGQEFNSAFGVNWFESDAYRQRVAAQAASSGPSTGQPAAGAAGPGLDQQGVRSGMRAALDERPLRVEVINPQVVTPPQAPGAAPDPRRGVSPRLRTGS